MNEKRLNEELSAYLDDESKDPRRIARLLQKDEAAARRYMELSKLSTHLQALPEPDVHPAFSTRVLAEVREAPRASKWPRVARRLSVGGAVLLLVAVAGWIATHRVPVSRDRDPEVAAVLELRHSNEPLGPLATLFEDDLYSKPAEAMPDDSALWEEAGTADYDDSVDTVIESIDWLASAEPSGVDTQDVDAMIGSLDDTEIAVLKDLLVEYATEDSTI